MPEPEPVPAPEMLGEALLVAPAGLGPVAITDEARAAVERVRELAQAPIERVRAAVAEPRFRDRAVAAALLVAADDPLAEAPVAERLAEAAVGILAQLDLDPQGIHLGMLAHGGSAIVRSCRRQGRLRGAERAFRRLVPFLLAAGASREKARVLAALAQVRRAERRLDESVALFVEAAGALRKARDRQGQAACHAQAGFVRLEQLDASRACHELARAAKLLDPELAPALAVRCALGLAWCLVDAGERDRARRRLRAARGLYERVPGAGERLCREWWEARIAAAFGSGSGDGGERAEERLDAVRRGLLAHGSCAEAASCTLDLLALRVQAGRRDAVGGLGHDLLDAFGHAAFATGPAMMIVSLAEAAARRSRDFGLRLVATRHGLAALRRGPPDRPRLIPDVGDLADWLLARSGRESE